MTLQPVARTRAADHRLTCWMCESRTVCSRKFSPIFIPILCCLRVQHIDYLPPLTAILLWLPPATYHFISHTSIRMLSESPGSDDFPSFFDAAAQPVLPLCLLLLHDRRRQSFLMFQAINVTYVSRSVQACSALPASCSA